VRLTLSRPVTILAAKDHKDRKDKTAAKTTIFCVLCDPLRQKTTSPPRPAEKPIRDTVRPFAQGAKVAHAFRSAGMWQVKLSAIAENLRLLRQTLQTETHSAVNWKVASSRIAEAIPRPPHRRDLLSVRTPVCCGSGV
jgi:hypothetical protein